MAFGQDVQKEFGFYWGKITSNKDPMKMGRVKVTVPGVVDTAIWAWPVGMPGSGSEQHGTYIVPREQATVLVGFINGDIDEMFYMAGPHRRDGIPTTPNEEDKDEAPNVRAIETETFEIVIKDTATEKKLILRSKGEDSGGEIEIDAVDKSIYVRADTWLILESVGGINIDAPVVQIRGRRILTSTREI